MLNNFKKITFILFFIMIILIGISGFFSMRSIQSVSERLPITSLEQHSNLRNIVDSLGMLSNSLILLKEFPEDKVFKSEASINLDICFSLFENFKNKIPKINYEKYHFLTEELEVLLDEADETINHHDKLSHIELESLWLKFDEIIVLFNTTYSDTNKKASTRLIAEAESLKKIKTLMTYSFITMLVILSYIWKLFREQDKTQSELESTQANLIKANKIMQQYSIKADKANEAKSEFLANMSHEIRTPMNAIIGLNHLMEKTPLNNRQKDYMSKSKKAAVHLLNLINDILDISKIESGKLELEEISFSVDSLLEDIGNVMSVKASEKSIELIIGKDTDIPEYLRGDLLRIEQILINLLSNAIKFTKKGEVILEIKLLKKINNKIKLLFSVSDSGIGIKDEDKDKLFNEFSQVDSSISRKYGGTGLGLSISNKLVNMMDGELKVESAFGKGSKFYFEIDLKIDNKKSSDNPKYPIPDIIRNMKIMLIEENNLVREIMEKYLSDIGIEYFCIHSSENALNALKHEKFDLIFIDHSLNNNKGIKVWESIKKDPMIKTKPHVILTTSTTDNNIVYEAEKENIHNILIKPVSESMIYNSIIETLYNNGQKEKVIESYNNQNNFSLELEMVRGAKILVVEDNDINQQVIKELLEEEKFIVTVASSGQECLDLLSNHYHFDLILMDIQMPEMDGIETSEHIRNKLGDKTTPIVALSANVTKLIRDKTLTVGIDDYLFKPIDINKLFETLIEYIKPKQRKIEIRNSVNKESNINFTENKYIDFFEGIKRVSGNEKLYSKLLESYIRNNKNIISEVKNQIKANNIRTAERLIHTLRGNSGNLGLKSVFDKAALIEEKLEKNIIDDNLNILIEDLEIELKARINDLEKLLEDKSQTKNSLKDEVSFLNKLKELIEEDIFEAKNFYDSELESNEKLINNDWTDLNEAIAIYDFESAINIINNKLHSKQKEEQID